jgi:hypothetical protein
MDQAVSPALVEFGHRIVDRAAGALGAGARRVHLQLLASWLFEAVKAELARTPLDQRDRLALLAAAAEQCRRSADRAVPLSSMLGELRAAVGILERARLAPYAAPPPRCRPELRVITGGLA